MNRDNATIHSVTGARRAGRRAVRVAVTHSELAATRAVIGRGPGTESLAPGDRPTGTVRRMIGPSDGHRRRPPGATLPLGPSEGARGESESPVPLRGSDRGTATESVALAAADGSEYPGNHDHAESRSLRVPARRYTGTTDSVLSHRRRRPGGGRAAQRRSLTVTVTVQRGTVHCDFGLSLYHHPGGPGLGSLALSHRAQQGSG